MESEAWKLKIWEFISESRPFQMYHKKGEPEEAKQTGEGRIGREELSLPRMIYISLSLNTFDESNAQIYLDGTFSRFIRISN